MGNIIITLIAKAPQDRVDRAQLAFTKHSPDCASLFIEPKLIRDFKGQGKSIVRQTVHEIKVNGVDQGIK